MKGLNAEMGGRERERDGVVGERDRERLRERDERGTMVVVEFGGRSEMGDGGY